MKKLLRKIDKAHFFYIFVILILFVIFIALAFLNVTVRKQIAGINLFETPLSFTPQNYPQIISRSVPEISAKGAVVIDSVSKVPLFEKNFDLRFPPASTTKIMTALVALEYYNLGDVLTIKQADVEGSMLGFENGQRFTFENLLYAMLLPSSNEAALAVAQNYPGGETAFITRMNEKAKELHLNSTHYADPIGLEDQSDYTTPFDLAILSSIALENQEFAKIVSAKTKQIASLAGDKYYLYSLNELLSIPGVNGVKTGHTEGAGDVLVTSRKINGGELIFVVMQSQDRFADTQNLIYYLDNNINYLSIHP